MCRLLIILRVNHKACAKEDVQAVELTFIFREGNTSIVHILMVATYVPIYHVRLLPLFLL